MNEKIIQSLLDAATIEYQLAECDETKIISIIMSILERALKKCQDQ